MRLKCVKCNSDNITLKEMWKDHCIYFDYENNKIDNEGYLKPGFPYKVIVRCNTCGYEWTKKNVRQVDELREGNI